MYHGILLVYTMVFYFHTIAVAFWTFLCYTTVNIYGCAIALPSHHMVYFLYRGFKVIRVIFGNYWLHVLCKASSCVKCQHQTCRAAPVRGTVIITEQSDSALLDRRLVCRLWLCINCFPSVRNVIRPRGESTSRSGICQDGPQTSWTRRKYWCWVFTDSLNNSGRSGSVVAW